jgi:hypothetical protein
MESEPNTVPAREATELRGLRRGGKCSGMRTLNLVVAVLALVACGGKQVGGGDGGGSGSSGEGGGAGSSGAGGSGGEVDGGTSDDGDCNMNSAPCAFCDGEWKCSGIVFPQCSSSVQAGGACTVAGSCVTCTAGTGYQFSCNGKEWVRTQSFMCSP